MILTSNSKQEQNPFPGSARNRTGMGRRFQPLELVRKGKELDRILGVGLELN